MLVVMGGIASCLPGQSHRQRSLAGYGPWGRESRTRLTALSQQYIYVCSVTQSCPTLCDPKGSSPPGSSVHGIFQASTLEWVAISFSRGSSRLRE